MTLKRTDYNIEQPLAEFADLFNSACLLVIKRAVTPDDFQKVTKEALAEMTKRIDVMIDENTQKVVAVRTPYVKEAND